MFKKKKIWKLSAKITKNSNLKTKKRSFFWMVFWTLSVILITIVWIWFISQLSWVKLWVDTMLDMTWFKINLDDIKKESNIKSTDWKTNILIIGRWWDENDAPDLTDSILIASINYENKTVSMFSVPRDLYVEFPTWWGWKINETYSRALRLNWKDKAKAIDSLKEVLKKITWEEIHYYVNMDFEWFRKVIDIIWWIQVNVPEKIVDTTYPWKNHTYTTFIVKPGLQNMNWETALKYARSRHSTSDFDRSLRQQLIISAIREKALSLWIITSPWKMKWIYDVLKTHIDSDLDISQMINLALFAKDIPKENIVNSNLNDTCLWLTICEKWGLLYVPNREEFGWASILLQVWWTKYNPNNYKEINKYTNIVFNFPQVYSENLKINIFNSTKVNWLASDIVSELKKYGFNIPKNNYSWNTSWDKYEKSVILYYSPDWKKPKTVEALEEFVFGWSKAITTLHKYSSDPEVKIEIIIWDDYKTLNF